MVAISLWNTLIISRIMRTFTSEQDDAHLNMDANESKLAKGMRFLIATSSHASVGCARNIHQLISPARIGNAIIP